MLAFSSFPSESLLYSSEQEEQTSTMSTNLEILIQDQAEMMASQMMEVAKWAKSEEDVRHECNKLIDEFIKKAGLQLRGRHEYGLAGGHIDSKYGGVIIEYKGPKGSGKLTQDRNAPGVKAVVKQIRTRFKDFQAEEHIEPNGSSPLAATAIRSSLCVIAEKISKSKPRSL